MEKRPFGKTGLEVSVLGFGGAPIGFLATRQKQIATMLNLLLDQGVNLLDTAAMYLESEKAIHQAVGHRRNEYLLVSKCPNSSVEPWTAEAVTNSIDRSLKNLDTDHVDVMLLHSCDMGTLQKGEVLQALVRAKEAGKIRFAGYSGDNEAAAYAATLPEIAVIQTSINICDQANIDNVLPLAVGNGTGVIGKRPIANAAWKNITNQPGMYNVYARTYTERFDAMGVTMADLGFRGNPDEIWPEMALRFTLSQPGVHTAIIGTTNPDHARANIEAAGKGPLSSEVIDRLRQAFQQAEKASGTRWPGQT